MLTKQVRLSVTKLVVHVITNCARNDVIDSSGVLLQCRAQQH